MKSKEHKPEPKKEYTPAPERDSPETMIAKEAGAAKYRRWAVAHFDEIGEESLIALFGCRGFHEIKDESRLAKEKAKP